MLLSFLVPLVSRSNFSGHSIRLSLIRDSNVAFQLRVVSLVGWEGLVNGFQIVKTWPINQFHYFISWYSPKPNIWSPW